ILTFHGPGMEFPAAPRCPDAKTTTNEGGNISIPAWNLFFANRGTISRLQNRSEGAKSALDRRRRDGVPTQNGLKAQRGSSIPRVTKLFCAADVTLVGSRRCDPVRRVGRGGTIHARSSDTHG